MRKAKVERKTKETVVFAEINLDGTGIYQISTGIPFLNHMLELFSRHSYIDINLSATGDIEVDLHHTVEDVGIVLGSALSEALGERKGIRRFGWSLLPMDDALAEVALDLSGRAYFLMVPDLEPVKAGNFPLLLIEPFFRAFTNTGKFCLHIVLRYGKDPHHIAEAIFKGVARALKNAVEMEGREKDIPSTKGII